MAEISGVSRPGDEVVHLFRVQPERAAAIEALALLQISERWLDRRQAGPLASEHELAQVRRLADQLQVLLAYVPEPRTAHQIRNEFTLSGLQTAIAHPNGVTMKGAASFVIVARGNFKDDRSGCCLLLEVRCSYRTVLKKLAAEVISFVRLLAPYGMKGWGLDSVLGIPPLDCCSKGAGVYTRPAKGERS
jgi:hypothetical protein